MYYSKTLLKYTHTRGLQLSVRALAITIKTINLTKACVYIWHVIINSIAETMKQPCHSQGFLNILLQVPPFIWFMVFPPCHILYQLLDNKRNTYPVDLWCCIAWFQCFACTEQCNHNFQLRLHLTLTVGNFLVDHSVSIVAFQSLACTEHLIIVYYLRLVFTLTIFFSWLAGTL